MSNKISQTVNERKSGGELTPGGDGNELTKAIIIEKRTVSPLV